MTTIAYRDGVIAADTAGYSGALIGHVEKISRRADGALCGACGEAAYCHAFQIWFLSGGSEPAPEAKETSDNLDRGVVFYPGGIIEIYEPRGMFRIEAEYFAFGSGRSEALGAMFAGADAETAVRAAMEHDPYTAGRITVLRSQA